MIINDQLFELEDQCDRLTAAIAESVSFQEYVEKKATVYQENHVSELIQDFINKKSSFEKIEAYGIHAPDYREKNRELRQAKRKLDLNPEVAEFRIAETNLQELLDSICLSIAETISESIKVDAGNPFFEKGNAGCRGNCHAS